MRKLAALLGLVFVTVMALGAPASAARCAWVENVPPGTTHQICVPD